MRTIIAGSRSITDPQILVEALNNCGWLPTVVICGGARGADALGKSWAKYMGIPMEMYNAQWELHGKAAGHIRNAVMSENAEALILLWDGKSTGSKNMRDTAISKGLKVFTYYI